jgi:hypothetical protein
MDVLRYMQIVELAGQAGTCTIQTAFSTALETILVND